MSYASEWSNSCNISFAVMEDKKYKDASIRINIDRSGESWSYVGTDCSSAAREKPTMNFVSQIPNIYESM